MRTTLLSCTALLSLCGGVAAQGHDNVWAIFEKAPSAIPGGVALSSPTIETDMAWGDLDQNGFLDVVIVRKQPFTTPGKRTNVLLMNDDGVLTNVTSTYAAASGDVPGDQGFLQLTNDRDVVITDVDGDGWLDVVTAPTLNNGEPKHIGYPRIYRNLGEDGAGDWLGLLFEDARFPPMYNFISGAQANPRFCGVDAGDVTGNGLPDLYFSDYGAHEDRLIVNDGTGYFTDDSLSRMSLDMLISAFGTSTAIRDFNQDGTADVLKNSAQEAPQFVSIAYNDLNDVVGLGNFNSFDAGIGSATPYHVNAGDLNADGRPDVVISDDGPDRYRLNLGNDVLGRAEFGSLLPYSFVEGGDTGFGSNAIVVDIDGDGWGEAIHADVDVDIPGSNRSHIYHNTGHQSGLAPGGEPVLREEYGSFEGSGDWAAVKGMVEADLTKVHDVAAGDFNNDGLVDLILSREQGTLMWHQVALTEQTDLGFGGPGSVELSVRGDDLTQAKSAARFEVRGVEPGALVNIALSAQSMPTPFKGGTLVPLPVVLLLALPADSAGMVAEKLFGGANHVVTVYAQAATVTSGGTFEFSNALEIHIGR